MWTDRRALIDLAPAHVRGFEAYVPSPPDAELMRRFGLPRLLRLHNNENHLGPPPSAKAVLDAFHDGPPGMPARPARAALYPSGDCFDLRRVLAARHGKDPEQFLVGNGSCEVIASVIKAFCEPGDNIVTADRTFAVYEWVAEFSGIEARLTPLLPWPNAAFDPQAMLDAMDARTKILFVCNPNNPTGGRWDQAAMEAFLDAVAGRAVVVLDEAYFEYVDLPDHPDGMRLMERHPNLVVFRTFSKMYGLAGLRVGWLCGGLEAVDVIRRTHLVYSVNAPGQEAALAAIADPAEDAAHVAATRRMVAEGKAFLRQTASRLGLETLGGEGNWLLLKVPMADTLLARRLLLRGVMVRAMTSFRFPGHVRVSMAPLPMLEALAQALEESLAETPAQ